MPKKEKRRPLVACFRAKDGDVQGSCSPIFRRPAGVELDSFEIADSSPVGRFGVVVSSVQRCFDVIYGGLAMPCGCLAVPCGRLTLVPHPDQTLQRSHIRNANVARRAAGATSREEQLKESLLPWRARASEDKFGMLISDSDVRWVVENVQL